MESTRVYRALHRLAEQKMSRQPAAHTLSATALVHETYLKLHGTDRMENEGKLMAVASRAMRCVLVDHARRKGRDKRSARGTRVPMENMSVPSQDNHDSFDTLALHASLQKLERIDPGLAELIELKSFGGMTEPEIAAATGKSLRTVQRHLPLGWAWLKRELE